MKFHALFLAAVLGAATLHGQETTPPGGDSPVLLAQAGPAGKKDTAVTSINDRGAKDPKEPASTPDDTTRISASSASPLANKNDPVNTITLWKLVQDGGWTMVPLGILSVITVMLVLVYIFTLRRSSILTPHYMNTADVLLKKRDYLGLLAISNRHTEAVARVVQRTLDFATKNPAASFEVVREIAETEASSQAASLQHRTVYLADIGMLSPMIGLLGTVIGIINSFHQLSVETSTSRENLLASGVSMALVATAGGLILGLIAMGFYSLFRNRVQSLISDLEIASTHILAMIAVNWNKKRETSRVAVDEEF